MLNMEEIEVKNLVPVKGLEYLEESKPEGPLHYIVLRVLSGVFAGCCVSPGKGCRNQTAWAVEEWLRRVSRMQQCQS